MDNTAQQTRASQFRALHAGGEALILANIWDGVSARLVQQCGVKAIATTSGGVSWAHGYADGGALPMEAHLATVREIVRVVQLPLTVDLEDGYSDDAEVVAANVAEFIRAGAVGINIEDGAGTPQSLAAKISAIREKAAAIEVNLFINVRTDVYLRGLVAPERQAEETIARAASYRQAGADGLFVPGLAELQALQGIAAAVQMPVNVMAWPGIANARQLYEHGARRISAGTALMQAMLANAVAMTNEVLATGSFEGLFVHAVGYGELNALLA